MVKKEAIKGESRKGSHGESSEIIIEYSMINLKSRGKFVTI